MRSGMSALTRVLTLSGHRARAALPESHATCNHEKSPEPLLGRIVERNDAKAVDAKGGYQCATSVWTCKTVPICLSGKSLTRRINSTSWSNSCRRNMTVGLRHLKSELDAVSAVIESEDRRLGQAPSVVKAQPQLRPSNLPEQAHSHPRLTDTPIPKMRAVSAR